MDILAAIKREEKKLEKQLGKIQHQLNGVRAARKSSRRFHGQRTQSRKEARPVCCCASQNWQSYEEAVGEVSGAGEERSRDPEAPKLQRLILCRISSIRQP
jgi:hypothetical protein